MRKKSRQQRSKPHQPARGGVSPQRERSTIWAVAVLEGCQDVARVEINRRLRGEVEWLSHSRSDEIHLRYEGPPAPLVALRTVQSLFIRRDFAVQRPRTLLSPEHLEAIAQCVQKAQHFGGPSAGTRLRFDAAGADSPTMRRLGQALADRLHMPFDAQEGDCVLALRPGGVGWEVLCRVGNRPLATRVWRKVDYRGSLNAALAASMIELSQPRSADRFVNLMCGGGTLLIERLHRAPAACAVGCDLSAEAVAASRENAAAAGVWPHVLRADARACGLPTAGFDVVVADLPYGRAHGARSENGMLYSYTLAEAARLCRKGGRAVFISEDVSSLRRALLEGQAQWELLDERTMIQRTFRPRCVTLRRRG